MGFIDLVLKFMEIVLHLDTYLGVIITQYGVLTYGVLFLVIFVETGIVFTPFLPGDSLLFASGTMAGMGLLNIWILWPLLTLAAVLGDTCNYYIGRFVGNKILSKNYRLINKEHVARTKKFFKKYGTETIIIARFIPIIRTFAPFMAGIGKMDYWKFLSYNVLGGILWVAVFTFGGYFFGGLKFVQENFSLVLLLIIFVSFIPVFIQVGKHLIDKRRKAASKRRVRK